MKLLASALTVVLGLALPLGAFAAQPADPTAPVEPTDPLAPATDPLGQPPSMPPSSPPPYQPPVADPVAPTRSEPEPAPRPRDEEPEMSEGRRIVTIWNTGFQWGIAPGVIISGGEASFALGLRFGWGFDTGTFILVPGLRLVGYFSTPGVYMGMPIMKVVLPIDRFAPFLEAGAGMGYVSKGDTSGAQTGLAVLGGGGFMIHFTWKFGLGVEANYQVITGTEFKGFGVGPIIALAF
jgi:hypothetical protein